MACQHRLARLIGFVLVLPFVLLAVIAPGYMPVRGADGAITMVICADGMAVEVAIDPATGEPVPHEAAPEDGRCAWAQLALAAHPVSEPDLAPPLRLVVADPPAAPEDLWRPAHDPRGLWARGPPAFV